MAAAQAGIQIESVQEYIEFVDLYQVGHCDCDNQVLVSFWMPSHSKSIC